MMQLFHVVIVGISMVDLALACKLRCCDMRVTIIKYSLLQYKFNPQEKHLCSECLVINTGSQNFSRGLVNNCAETTL